MLYVQGAINGEYVDGNFTAEKVALMFGVKALDNKTTIQLTQPQRIDVFQQKRHANGLLLNNFFNANFKGSPVFVRYYKSKVNKPSQGNQIIEDYQPRKTEILRTAMESFLIKDDKERLLYLLLHPSCGASPMDKQGKKLYFIHDADALATARIDARMLKKKYEDLILSEENAALTRLQGYAFGVATKGMNIKLIQERLLAKLEENFTAFSKQWDNGNAHVHGTIRQAIDEGLLLDLGGRWQMSLQASEAIGETQPLTICDVRPGEDPKVAITTALVSDQTLFKKIISAMNALIINAEASKIPMDALYPKVEVLDTKPVPTKGISEYEIPEIIGLAEKQEIIYFDRTKLEVWALDAKGNPKTMILKVTSIATWRIELEDFLQNKQPDVLKQITGKIKL